MLDHPEQLLSALVTRPPSSVGRGLQHHHPLVSERGLQCWVCFVIIPLKQTTKKKQRGEVPSQKWVGSVIIKKWVGEFFIQTWFWRQEASE
jgi:hypothetical protein